MDFSASFQDIESRVVYTLINSLPKVEFSISWILCFVQGIWLNFSWEHYKLLGI